MSNEGISNNERVYPENYNVQLHNLGSMEERTAEALLLQHDIEEILNINNIQIIQSTSRAKSIESIWAKIHRRMSYCMNDPLGDVYGVRIILNQDHIYLASKLLLEHFNAPKLFPWRLSSFVDYSQRGAKFRFPYSLPSYQAVHVYIPFGTGDIYKIGEVQLMTPDQLKNANRNRRYFERKQGRHISNSF